MLFPFRWTAELVLMIDSGLVGPLWEGCRESRRCSRDTYPESYINEYTLAYEDKRAVLAHRSVPEG